MAPEPKQKLLFIGVQKGQEARGCSHLHHHPFHISSILSVPITHRASTKAALADVSICTYTPPVLELHSTSVARAGQRASAGSWQRGFPAFHDPRTCPTRRDIRSAPRPRPADLLPRAAIQPPVLFRPGRRADADTGFAGQSEARKETGQGWFRDILVSEPILPGFLGLESLTHPPPFPPNTGDYHHRVPLPCHSTPSTSICGEKHSKLTPHA